MQAGFSVDFFSDSRYEFLTAEISFNGQILCQINRDKGVDRVEIEFFPDQRLLEKTTTFKFPLDEFISLVEEIKSELLEIE